jgi:hypothetical protein
MVEESDVFQFIVYSANHKCTQSVASFCEIVYI